MTLCRNPGGNPRTPHASKHLALRVNTGKMKLKAVLYIQDWRRRIRGRMNQNDMDRYFWRTGHRWSGDFRSPSTRFPRAAMSRWAVLLLGASFLITVVVLIFSR